MEYVIGILLLVSFVGLAVYAVRGGNLMMGMLSGVYTSLCVSTSAWVVWSERKKADKN